MHSDENTQIVEKLIRIAKKSLKPAKIPQEKQEFSEWRFELTAKNLKNIAIILLLSMTFSSFYWWSSRNIFSHKSDLIIPAQGNVEPIESTNQAISEIFVYVSGGVINPGVYKLKHDSRVIDALDRAGGLADKGEIGENNLARILSDGEQIDFSKNSKINNSKDKLKSEKSKSCINLNTATLSELDSLPGVGPVLAQRILDWKESNGGFKSLEQLGEVEGIGKSKFSTISSKSCV